jgi:hypothetical protein
MKKAHLRHLIVEHGNAVTNVVLVILCNACSFFRSERMQCRCEKEEECVFPVEVQS